MNRVLRAAVAALAPAISFADLSAAGPLEDGVNAAKSGDYATAMRLSRPLAEAGRSKGSICRRPVFRAMPEAGGDCRAHAGQNQENTNEPTFAPLACRPHSVTARVRGVSWCDLVF